MIRRPPRSTRTDTLSLHDALPIADSSVTGAFGSFDTGGGFTATTGQPERSGHYDVAGGLIILIPPEGEPRVAWIILEDVNSVIIGGQPVSATDDEDRTSTRLNSSH